MTTLEKVFSKLADMTQKVDDAASGILKAVKEAGADTLDKFDALVMEAYEAHGWNYKAGRPLPGTEVEPVPVTIRTYVSEVRAAYREDLDVFQFDSMYALRLAVRRNRKPIHPSETRALWSELPELNGLRISKGAKFNGALFHDLVIAYEKAPPEVRTKAEARVKRMLKDIRAVLEEEQDEQAA